MKEIPITKSRGSGYNIQYPDQTYFVRNQFHSSPSKNDPILVNLSKKFFGGKLQIDTFFPSSPPRSFTMRKRSFIGSDFVFTLPSNGTTYILRAGRRREGGTLSPILLDGAGNVLAQFMRGGWGRSQRGTMRFWHNFSLGDELILIVLALSYTRQFDDAC
jgi:hypothetical protein